MEQTSLGRLVGTLVAPGKTFTAIAGRPTWAAALIVLLAISLVVTLVVTPRLDMGKMIREQIESSGRKVPAETLDRQVEMMQKFRWVFAFAGVVIQPIVYVIVALVFWVVFRLLGSELDFRRSFAVTLHGFLPLAVAGLLSIPVILSRSELDYEQVKAGSFLFSNPAAFLAPETAKWMVALLASLDLFSLWCAALLGIGYRIVARVSRGAAFGAVGALWAVYILGKVGLSAIF